MNKNKSYQTAEDIILAVPAADELGKVRNKGTLHRTCGVSGQTMMWGWFSPLPL
jgi:hypothetical protein